MKYIVTGGAGFIGSHIVEKLHEENKDILVIDDLSTGNPDNIKHFLSKIKFVKGSILDLKLLKENIGEGDIIFHQAAIPSVFKSVKDPISTTKANVEGTLNVLIAARDNQVKRVIFASSSSIYGDSETLPKIENMGPNPKSPYALSKYAAEKYMQMFYKIYGLETISLRYFNVFGPRQNPDSEYSAVIPKFIKLMKQGKQPIIYGDGEQTRDFTPISEVVTANLLAAKTEKGIGEVFNIALGERISLNMLVIKINEIIGTSIEPLFSEERGGDVKHSLADISKAKALLNYNPKLSFFKGLQITQKHY